jgi:hypothetical protein
MSIDPATLPPSAVALDRIAEFAEGMRRNMAENPDATIVDVIVGSFIIFIVMKAAELIIRIKAGLLPAPRSRTARAARPAPAPPIARQPQRAAVPPIRANHPRTDSREPAPEHAVGSHRQGDRADTEASTHPDSPVSAAEPIPIVCAGVPIRLRPFAPCAVLAPAKNLWRKNFFRVWARNALARR